MSGEGDGTTLRGAASSFAHSIGGAILEFWNDVEEWFGNLKTAYKVFLLIIGYVLFELGIDVFASMAMSIVSGAISSLSGWNFTITGFDLLFLIIYMLFILIGQVYIVMRRINNLRTELEDMVGEQKRLDGGRVTRTDRSEPLLWAVFTSRAFLLANIGFVIGFPFGYEQAFTLALTGAFAGILFPSD